MAPTQPPEGEDGDFGTVGAGRYRLTKRLGRGGMAEVFLADDVRLSRPVAVKLLRTDLAEDSVARQRFMREAQAVAGLNHHAVVAVYDTGEDVVNGETLPFIVMELVEGRTIRELLVDAEEPPVEQALIVASGVLDALAYSHRTGIVHRDIKPANVSITNTGAVKVMDFGIARAMSGASSTMTQTGMVMGTPQYLSPEQALGKGVDARSDLYATGCLLYELLTLRPPFTGETPLSVVYQHVQDPPVPPSQANPRVPEQLDGLVLASLAKDPDERFQSADEMRAAIQNALRELTGVAPTAATDVLPMGRPQGSTPVGGVPTGATSQMPPQDGPPVPLGDEQPPRRGRGKVIGALLLVAAAVAAIIIALNMFDLGSEDPGPTAPSHSSSTPGTTHSSPTESQSPPPEPTETETGEQQPPPPDSDTPTFTEGPTRTGPPNTQVPSDTAPDGGQGGPDGTQTGTPSTSGGATGNPGGGGQGTPGGTGNPGSQGGNGEQDGGGDEGAQQGQQGGQDGGNSGDDAGDDAGNTAGQGEESS